MVAVSDVGELGVQQLDWRRKLVESEVAVRDGGQLWVCSDLWITSAWSRSAPQRWG